MTKTEHYQLNQWVPEDPVRREDFNQDNLNIENALVAHDEAVSAALKEHKTKVTAALSAQEERLAGANLVKLGAGTAQSAKQEVVFDLSEVDMDGFAALLLLSGGYCPSRALMGFKVNGGSGFTMMNMQATDAYESSLSFMAPVGTRLVFGSLVAGNQARGANSSTAELVGWNEIKTLTLYGEYDAGAWAVVYGFRK